MSAFPLNPTRSSKVLLLEDGLAAFDGTVIAQKALSAVYRTGQMFGTGHLIDVLLGHENEKTSRFGHTSMPVFGVERERDRSPRRLRS